MLGNKQKGKHVGYIRVQSSNEDTIAKALDVLRPLGVELLTSETIEEEELILFYLSRMNNKFDNLGQLRHLVKIERDLSEMKQISKKIEDERQKTFLAQVAVRRVLFNYLTMKAGRNPAHDGIIDKWMVDHLTLDEIRAIFETVEHIDNKE